MPLARVPDNSSTPPLTIELANRVIAFYSRTA
jgi:hypothetical protein